jgi:hypothetical protein
MTKQSNKVKRQRQQRKAFDQYSKEASKRYKENQFRITLEDWAFQSGLKYETLRDLAGLNFQ